MVVVHTVSQGLTLVHFSAQRKRFLWDKGVHSGNVKGVFSRCCAGGIRGYLRCILCQKRLRLS